MHSSVPTGGGCSRRSSCRRPPPCSSTSRRNRPCPSAPRPADRDGPADRGSPRASTPPSPKPPPLPPTTPTPAAADRRAHAERTLCAPKAGARTLRGAVRPVSPWLRSLRSGWCRRAGATASSKSAQRRDGCSRQSRNLTTPSRKVLELALQIGILCSFSAPYSLPQAPWSYYNIQRAFVSVLRSKRRTAVWYSYGARRSTKMAFRTHPRCEKQVLKIPLGTSIFLGGSSGGPPHC